MLKLKIYSRYIFITALILILPCETYARTITVSEDEYGEKWSFVVAKGILECNINAVVMHTDRGTFSINGKAMGRYRNKYPTWREIAKPAPGLEFDKTAKMPPPSDLIKRGLDLCQSE